MAAYSPWTYRLALKKIEETKETQRPWLILERLGLAELPSELYDLTHLEELVVIDNLLRTLPEELPSLTNLKRLYLFYNEINEMPGFIGEMKSLTHLDLSCNKIEKLPKQIMDLENLKYLDLRCNHLSIPENILERVKEPQVILQAYFSEQSVYA